MADINKIIIELNKAYGKDVVGFAKDMEDVKRISSGSSSFDWATGGGFPMGRITELYGPYSSGKTLIAMMAIVEAQKKDIPCVFIDAEMSFEKKHAESVGIDLSKLILIRSSSGEKLFDFIRKIMTDIPQGLLIFDSVAAIVPMYEDDNETQKQTMGLAARLMSKGLRIINATNEGWAVVFINQVREKIGVMFGNPETTTGGRALPFFASLRVNVRGGEKYEENKIKVGQEVKFRVEKSKVSAPGRDGSFRYMYGEGIDLYEDIISLALRLRVCDQAGAWYTFNGERFQGRTAIEERAKADPAFFESLRAALQEKWNSKENSV
jgi:recombination protein RecA